MGGVLRRQSLGDQSQTTLSCDTSTTITAVTLRANAEEEDAHLKPCSVCTSPIAWGSLLLVCDRDFGDTFEFMKIPFLCVYLFIFGCAGCLLLREVAPL